MLPGGRRRDAATRSAGQETEADEEGLGELFDGFALFADGHGERLDADRSPAEALAQSSKDGPVEAVESECVDFIQVERGVGRRLVDDALGSDLGEVADPSQQPVGDTGCATRA